MKVEIKKEKVTVETITLGDKVLKKYKDLDKVMVLIDKGGRQYVVDKETKQVLVSLDTDNNGTVRYK